MTRAPRHKSGDDFARPDERCFDLRDPRAAEREYQNQAEVLEDLVLFFDVEELVEAIARSGWQDYEPLIVLREGRTVLEGNRRLAALRLLSNASLREQLSLTIPEALHPKAIPDQVRVRWVKDRAEARAFIGFKHINGPFKWDALAKARYAAAWCEEEVDATAIARQLGDTHNTVVRLVNGWNVLQQSRKLGFDMEQVTRKPLALSHLHRALARPNVRRFLNLDPDLPASRALGPDPVPLSHRKELLTLMAWLYGQNDQERVIRTPNPDLNRLVQVLGNENALSTLRQTGDLHKAYVELEDKSERFRSALTAAMGKVAEAASLVAHYRKGNDLMRTGTELRRTVVQLHESMRAVRDHFIPSPSSGPRGWSRRGRDGGSGSGVVPVASRDRVGRVQAQQQRPEDDRRVHLRAVQRSRARGETRGLPGMGCRERGPPDRRNPVFAGHAEEGRRTA